MNSSLGAGARIARFGRRSPVGLMSLLAIVAIVVVALLGPFLAPHEPLTHDLDNRLQAPGPEHWMGTDNFGRDVFSRVVHGARSSLAVGLISIAFVALLGTALGTLSAFVGGKIDLVAQRAVDTLIAFPALVLALILVAAFGPSTLIVIAAVVIALTPHVIRLARARCLELKDTEYVPATRSPGGSTWRVVTRHVIPHAMPSVLVLSTGFVGKALVLEAALSFLGLGIPPPEPAWGRMIFEGASLYLETAPWLTIFPGLVLSFVVIAFAFLGDALRDELDPHHRNRRPQPRGRTQ